MKFEITYGKIKRNLELLEKKLEKLKNDRNNVRLECSKLRIELHGQEDLLKSLENEKTDLLQKVYNSYEEKFLFLSVTIFSVTLFGLIYVCLILPFINIFTDQLSTVYDYFITCVKGFGTIVVADYFDRHILEKKVFPILIERKVNKVINSKEYQDLLERIKTQEKQVELAKTNVTKKVESFNSINTKYNKIKQEEAEQKILLNYFDKQMNPTETTLHISRGLKPEHKDYINNIDNKC